MTFLCTVCVVAVKENIYLVSYVCLNIIGKFLFFLFNVDNENEHAA